MTKSEIEKSFDAMEKYRIFMMEQLANSDVDDPASFDNAIKSTDAYFYAVKIQKAQMEKLDEINDKLDKLLKMNKGS